MSSVSAVVVDSRKVKEGEKGRVLYENSLEISSDLRDLVKGIRSVQREVNQAITKVIEEEKGDANGDDKGQEAIDDDDDEEEEVEPPENKRAKC